MIRLSREDSERMVLSILSEIAKVEGKDFAEQSFKIIDNPNDNAILTGVLMNKAKQSVFSEEEELLCDSLIEIIGAFFYKTKINESIFKDCFSEKIIDAFKINTEDNLDDYLDNLHKRMKIKFAVSQFVCAFMEYERMEKQYPNVMNFMDER